VFLNGLGRQAGNRPPASRPAARGTDPQLLTGAKIDFQRRGGASEQQGQVTMRKSYGFRTFLVLEMALYHSLGKLPEPESTHDFF
jgi:hypothetical protein